MPHLVHRGLPSPELVVSPVFGGFLPRLNSWGWFENGWDLASTVSDVSFFAKFGDSVWVLHRNRTLQLAAGRVHAVIPGDITGEGFMLSL